MTSKFAAVNETASSSTEDVSLPQGKMRSIESTTRIERRRRLLKIAAIVAAVLVVAILALGLGLGLGLNRQKAAPEYPSKDYALVEQYQGTNFFNKFDYFSDADPTNGFTLYQLRANAQYENYTYASTTSAIIRPATSATSTGVNSVRIQSTRNYTQGLFLLDLAHMPVGCGTWPAFWTTDADNWPDHGEIDILEGVHLNERNQMTLHTSSSCSVAGIKRNETGTALSDDCASGSSTTGCGVNDTTHDSQSYGAAFNANGGGFFAMDWRSSGIRIWFFPRSKLPADLQVLSDDPASTVVPTMRDWGTSVANFPASDDCDFDAHFTNHKIIFDLTFCGDWAGAASVWNASTSCYDPTTAPTCVEYMRSSALDLSEAYFEVKSLNVYQYSGEGATVVGSDSFAATA